MFGSLGIGGCVTHFRVRFPNFFGIILKKADGWWKMAAFKGNYQAEYVSIIRLWMFRRRFM
ncbi:MAG TPA: hypothetical protein VFN30_01400 [Chitinophagaceae bacterium]|nr:hypothetical protein [Chitinophagaceae bacterium]